MPVEHEQDTIDMPPSQLDDLESLPDFPIPTPTLSSSSSEEEEPVDTSAVTRIVVPALELDTAVKYVPFDGLTWLIAGLKQEVAWMATHPGQG